MCFKLKIILQWCDWIIFNMVILILVNLNDWVYFHSSTTKIKSDNVNVFDFRHFNIFWLCANMFSLLQKLNDHWLNTSNKRIQLNGCGTNFVACVNIPLTTLTKHVAGCVYVFLHICRTRMFTIPVGHHNAVM